jgi:hypothetical protein
MKLEIAICFFALIAPVLLIVEVAMGASFPFWVFAVPVLIYLGLFCKLLVNEIKGKK